VSVVGTGFTTCATWGLVLVAKLVEATYVAVMLCVATVNVVVENVAVCTPPTVVRVPDPSVVAPSLKSTVPVGSPAPGLTAATVAVNVTDCPNTEGLSDEASVVVVDA